MYDARGIQKLVWGFEYQELRFKIYHTKTRSIPISPLPFSAT